MSSRERPGFFSGSSNFHISGGTFNDVSGDLNQYYTHNFDVQYNQVNGNITRYNSPTIVNFAFPPSTAPYLRHSDAGGPRRGAGRGNSSGTRTAPYNTITRGSGQYASPPPHNRTSRMPGRGGPVSSPDAYSSAGTPISQGPSLPPRTSPRTVRQGSSNSSGTALPEQSGSGNRSLDHFRHDTSWAYTPSYTPPPAPAPPAIPRNPGPDEGATDSEYSSESEDGDESDESEAGHSPDFAAPQGPSNNRARERRQSI
ncbi:hypothetical protein B0H17DRAFT_663873 [Mycena rosella]|uniref:Uncharacterized protein n=1 Tax=Mycena rosella TaxID=1033263 RepID=A0AAD7GTZ2_MYCRO|nr:hypothetical protein B0H17DRAFT_663873 [Mycena rosella]